MEEIAKVKKQYPDSNNWIHYSYDSMVCNVISLCFLSLNG